MERSKPHPTKKPPREAPLRQSAIIQTPGETENIKRPFQA
jgi:hypothetical protein